MQLSHAHPSCPASTSNATAYTQAKSQTGWVALQAGGAADLVCSVGHNGLMDMNIEPFPEATADESHRAAAILACKSRQYFTQALKKARCRPLITTTGLMSPEAYTLDAVVRAWAADAKAPTIHRKAAEAYARYQKCSVASAEKLFAAE